MGKFWINYQSSQIIQEIFWNLLFTHRGFWIFRTLHSKDFSLSRILKYTFQLCLDQVLVFKVILCTYFYLLLSICKRRLYNLKSSNGVNMKRRFMSVMFIHLQFYFRNYFFTRADFSFDWLIFIKSIWWNRTRPIFSKSRQTDLMKQKY